MKKLFALLAVVLAVVSCQKDVDNINVNVDGKQETVVTVTLPEVTRAASELSGWENQKGKLNVIFQVYDENGKTRPEMRQTGTIDYGQKTINFNVRLVPNRQYTFVAWADQGNANQGYYFDTNNLEEVTFVANTWNAMSEIRDAYTATKTIPAAPSIPAVSLELTRPFAKVRVVTTDIEAVTNLGLALKDGKVTYTTALPTSFNVVKGKVNDATEVKEHVIDYQSVVYTDNNGEKTLFTDYVLIPEDGVVNFSLTVNDMAKEITTVTFNTDIPVERNKLTTIKGNILTGNTDVNIKVEDEFDNGSEWNPGADNKDIQTISSEAELVAAANNGGKYIVISDLNVTGVTASTQAATRATGATVEGKVTTINLNGKTITVTNKTTAPIATVAAGNTLILEGGYIVLAEDSTASFIKNEGNVVLKAGEINNHDNNNVPVIDGNGKIVVNDAELNDEKVNNNNIIEDNAAWFADVLANGGTYVLTADMKDDQIKVTATAPVVLDGNGYTFTYTGSDRAIEIPKEATGANVTIKNLNIALKAGYCERCINFNVTGGTLTIDNVKVSETGTAATYAINLPGLSDNAIVVITNSYLRGNIALNVWGENVRINATGSEFVSFDGTEVENYSAISLNNDGTTIADGTDVTIEGGKIIALDENGEKSNAIRNSTNSGTVTVSESTEVIGILSEPVAIVTYAGYDQFYSCITLQQAINKAAENSNATVKLIKDITLDEPVMVEENQTIVLNLNGKTINGPSEARDAEGNRIHVIVNNGSLTVNGEGLIKSVATNGGSAILNNGVLTLDNVTIQGAPSETATGYASYTVNTEGDGSTLVVNNSSISGRGAIGATNGTKVELNGGTYHNPTVAWGHAIYADGEGTEVVVNGGTFTEGYEYKNDLWGMYQIYSSNKAKVIVNGGDFSQTWDCANGYDLCTATEGTIEIYGGTFAEDPSKQNGKNFVAEGYAVIENNTYTVIPTVLTDGYVLDLGGAKYDGTITVEGNVTIKGDTEIKTLKSTTGCAITIEDGKTLTLNNFSFGAKENAGAEYEIKGGTVTANYGFFQHGKYALYSNFETGYMYYSYGSDITVYGTFHSQGKGDGLDYVRGKLTIAEGGKSIHDKSLWVGQPASWGAMSASLVIEAGGYVQANSLSVYEGSSLTYSNDADLKYNSVTGTEYITKRNPQNL